MRRHLRACVALWAIFIVIFLLCPPWAKAGGNPSGKTASNREITLDFNDVDLPIFVRLISELTQKNFIIDEKVRGKISIISPRKIPLDEAYDVFLSALEMKGLTVVKSGEFYLIRPFSEMLPDRGVHVYTLRNMKSDEMAKVLRGLVAKPASRRRKVKPLSKGLSSPVQILTDKATNSLIITATDSDYAILKKVIEKLDMERRQVYVEAVVLELSADKFKEFGTDISAAFGYISGGESVAAVGGFNGLNLQALSSLAGLNGVSIGSVNIQAILSALKSSSEVNILSTPQILTSDKQKAEIVVAQNVPFPGSQTTSGVGTVQTTVERKDVGIILRLTPDVLDDHRVQLDVYQEISSVIESVVTSGGENLGPTTNKRSASTTVVVRSGETVVIGGLIKDNVISIDRKVPFLGDIPLLGWLFHFKSTRMEKTNLMIFLTPHIILNEKELLEIKKQKAEGSSSFMQDNLKEIEQKGRIAVFNEMINLPE